MKGNDKDKNTSHKISRRAFLKIIGASGAAIALYGLYNKSLDFSQRSQYYEKLPYITVSSRGIVNGQSSIPNDGADFGPDTMLGATSPDQYGPPYTQTTGIQEAIDYSYNAVQNFQVPVKLLTGGFYLYTGVKVNPKVSAFTMYGMGTMPTYIAAYTNDDMFLFNPNWTGGLQVEIDNVQPFAASGYTPNSFVNISPPSKMNWIFQSINLNIAN